MKRNKWPEQIVVFTSSNGLQCYPKTNDLLWSDERVYVLAPKRKARKKPGTGGGSK